MPTVSIYDLVYQCAMCTIKQRKVVTLDIPAVYLQITWPKGKHPTYIHLKGEMVDMICEIDSKYINYILVMNQGERILIGKMNKAIYNNVSSGLLFYQKLATFLEQEGFEVNPYNAFTWNKQVQGSKMTIQFYVDNICFSHKSQKELDKILSMINGKSKTKNQELTVTRGNVRDYLGITIDFSDPKLVQFTMYELLEGILSELDERGVMKGSRNYNASY